MRHATYLIAILILALAASRASALTIGDAAPGAAVAVDSLLVDTKAPQTAADYAAQAEPVKPAEPAVVASQQVLYYLSEFTAASARSLVSGEMQQEGAAQVASSSPVPEPATALLLAAGLGLTGLGVAARRSKRT